MCKVNKNLEVKHSNFWAYNMYNVINKVYYYLHFVNKNNIIFYNALKKKKILILLNKLGLLSSYYRLRNIPWFLINVNISHDGPDIKRYNLLSLIRTKSVKPIIRRLIGNYNPLLPIIKNVPGFLNYMIKWYMSSNRNERDTFNLNNIVLLGEDLRLMLKGWSNNYIKFTDYKINIFAYFKELLKKCILISLIIKLIKIKKLTTSIKKYNKLLLKYSIIKNKVIRKIIKLLNFEKIIVDKLFKMSNFYMQFFKKFDMIYKRYIEIQNIEINNYAKFSFRWKVKSSDVKKKFLIKNYNYAYFINNIFLKFFIFIFIHWMNLHMVLFYNEHNDKTNYLYNINKQHIIMININKHYTEVKYRRKAKKINFLNYFFNSSFILYFKNIGMYNNNYVAN